MTYLDYFKEICSMPHGSGNTKIISDWLVKFAKDHNLEHYQDAANNVIIIKEASKGMEDKPAVIIQGHMDMVAVHDDDRIIDMEKEGLILEQDGDFLFAKGTSLGGDDGIAVAYGLALLSDDSLTLPRIELVITVDEEVGMLGAAVIDLSSCKAKTMLNIDSEEEGIFLVSCAGGARIDFDYPLKKAEAKEGTAYKITVNGLIGGHSGTEINKGRANAICLMGGILKKLSDAKLLLSINSINGGTADNVICNSCEAVVLCKPIEPELFEIIKFEVSENYLNVETGLNISLSEVKGDFDWYESKEGLLANFLTALPFGVMAMSKDIEGLVETSLNLGIIKLENSSVSLSISVRSNVDEEKDELINSLKEIADNNNTSYSVRGEYPGWAYKSDSPLREKMVRIYEEMYGEKPEVQALHAGLECGVFAYKIKDLDCISFGPNMYDIHSTKERMSLSSAERTWKFLLKVLSE
ncbi:MAG: aminoacyl-histidine dipeptidase [Lachnospiraceae bacterium]|nr:aminoacyl-histidine dipeptidase [Lachnospiraceae bacterium]